MKSLDEARAEIDEIDRALVPLIVRRLEAVCDIAEAKRATGMAVHDPGREKAILEGVAAAAGAEFGDEAKTVFETLFDVAVVQPSHGVPGPHGRLLERPAYEAHAHDGH